MDEEIPRKRTTRFTRAARAARILKRARDGFAYDDLARVEGITVRRVRQIVADEIKRREAEDEGATYANLQLAMRVACEKLAQGDAKAIAPFVKVIDRLDRYQELAREARPRRTRSPEDAVVMRELVRRIRRDAPPSPPVVPAAPPPPDAPLDPPPPVAERTDPPVAATVAAAPLANESRRGGRRFFRRLFQQPFEKARIDALNGT